MIASVGAGVQDPRRLVERVVLGPAVTVDRELHAASAVVEGVAGEVRSARGAVPAFRLVRFPGPPPEPDVRLSPHPALHEVVPIVGQVRARLTVSRCCPGSGNG
ncbi:hypothetical protein GCM10023350_29980 [Nocardioides endophyticus]|uniref:Uncharacterized protein n=1 Tax=Nocardioides endophyticus TaxID=1353775 RepID=A0ABP8Z064_9ACTN